jgi:hypothetical protein
MIPFVLVSFRRDIPRGQRSRFYDLCVMSNFSMHLGGLYQVFKPVSILDTTSFWLEAI